MIMGVFGTRIVLFASIVCWCLLSSPYSSSASTLTKELEEEKMCFETLDCLGTWHSLDVHGWTPTVKTNKKIKYPDEILAAHNYKWVTFVGDSNMRYLYYEFVFLLCKKDALCTIYAPFQRPRVKSTGVDISSVHIADTMPKQSHQDLDVIVSSSRGDFRISFRMLVGQTSRTFRTLDNIGTMYCMATTEDPDTCKENGYHPSLIRPFSNMTSPSVLFVNDGCWDFHNMLDEDVTKSIIRKLGCDYNNTRVVWLTHYPLRLDIMKSSDTNHYKRFMTLGLEYAKSVIPKANKMRFEFAEQYEIETMDVNKMAVDLDKYFEDSLGEQTFENAHLFSIDYKKEMLSVDGVHQSKFFYEAVVKQLMVNLLVCSNASAPFCYSDVDDDWQKADMLSKAHGKGEKVTVTSKDNKKNGDDNEEDGEDNDADDEYDDDSDDKSVSDIHARSGNFRGTHDVNGFQSNPQTRLIAKPNDIMSHQLDANQYPESNQRQVQTTQQMNPSQDQLYFSPQTQNFGQPKQNRYSRQQYD
jgi:hypothetical protein